MVSRDQHITYSSDIAKHLLKYEENETKTRFVHYDMGAFEAETIAIVNLFEDMNGENPMVVKINNEIIPPIKQEEIIHEGENWDVIMQKVSEGIEVWEEIQEKSEEEISQKAPEEAPEEVLEEIQEKEYNLALHEISIKNRADILLFLWYLKADSVEFSKFIKKIRKEEVKRNKEEKIKSEKHSEKEQKSENIEIVDEQSETNWWDTEPTNIGKDVELK